MILLSNFANNKISEKLLNDFAVVAIEMMKGGREGAGSSNELDAVRNTQSNCFFYILDISGGFLWKA